MVPMYNGQDCSNLTQPESLCKYENGSPSSGQGAGLVSACPHPPIPQRATFIQGTPAQPLETVLTVLSGTTTSTASGTGSSSMASRMDPEDVCRPRWEDGIPVCCAQTSPCLEHHAHWWLLEGSRDKRDRDLQKHGELVL